MDSYDCVTGLSESPADCIKREDGEWVAYEDAMREIESLRSQLSDCQKKHLDAIELIKEQLVLKLQVADKEMESLREENARVVALIDNQEYIIKSISEQRNGYYDEAKKALEERDRMKNWMTSIKHVDQLKGLSGLPGDFTNLYQFYVWATDEGEE